MSIIFSDFLKITSETAGHYIKTVWRKIHLDHKYSLFLRKLEQKSFRISGDMAEKISNVPLTFSWKLWLFI